MAENNNNKLNTVDRVASVESVDKALTLLRNRVVHSTKRKSNEETREKTIHGQCLINFTSTHKKTPAASAFTHTHAVTELRNALINEDWSAIQEMFPLLLKCLYAQPLIWRYAFLIYLLCPFTDLSCFQEFFKMTIGEIYVDNEFYLEKLMTLHPEIKPDIQ